MGENSYEYYKRKIKETNRKAELIPYCNETKEFFDILDRKIEIFEACKELVSPVLDDDQYESAETWGFDEELKKLDERESYWLQRELHSNDVELMDYRYGNGRKNHF